MDDGGRASGRPCRESRGTTSFLNLSGSQPGRGDADFGIHGRVSGSPCDVIASRSNADWQDDAVRSVSISDGWHRQEWCLWFLEWKSLHSKKSSAIVQDA